MRKILSPFAGESFRQQLTGIVTAEAVRLLGLTLPHALARSTIIVERQYLGPHRLWGTLGSTCVPCILGIEVIRHQRFSQSG